MTHPSLSRPWAILEDWLRLMADAKPSADFPVSASPPSLSTDKVAVIRVEGPLVRHAEGGLFAMLFGELCSYDSIAAQFSAAVADSSVSSIVLAVDSPGGDVNGCADLSDMIYAARGSKPITAYVSGYGASAAYWIASAADRVLCSSTSLLGSIGVRCVLTSTAKRDEMEGVKRVEIVSSQSPYKATDPDKAEDVSRVQAQIDALASVFVNAVARNRGVSAQDVIKRYGAGDCLVGADAVKAGLADGLATLDAAINFKESDMKCKKCEQDIGEEQECYCAGCVKPEGLVEDPEEDEEAKSAKAMVASVATLAGKPGAEALGVITAWRDAAQQVEALRARVALLEGEKSAAEFGALVESGIKAGKLSPAMAASSWITGLRSSPQGAAQLAAYLDAATSVLPVEAHEPEGKGAPVALTDEEIKNCRAMGVDIDKYRAAKSATK